MPKPRQPVPALDVPLIGGGRWVLAGQRPRRFSLVVFYRGVHSPQCEGYVTQLDSLVDDLAAVGVTSVLAVSGDDEGRAWQAVEEWRITRVPLGYGLSPWSMQEWGLHRSKAVREGQSNEFNEPGLFIVRPDGTLYASVVGTLPFLRPDLDEVVEMIRWVNENDYPARGEL